MVRARVGKWVLYYVPSFFFVSTKVTNTLCGDATCSVYRGPWPHPLSGSCDRGHKAT